MKLAFKLVSALMLGLIVIITVHGWLSVRRESRRFELDAQADAERLGDVLEETVFEAWQQRGHQGVLDLIREASEYEHTMEIHWVRFDAQPGDPFSPTASPDQITAVIIQQHLTVPARAPDGTPYLNAYWPVAVDPEHRVGLEFSRSMAGLDEHKRDLITRTLLLFASILLMNGVFAVFLGVRLVGRPLDRLIDKTRRIGSGDLAGPIHLDTHDEFAELAESLNQMCDQLLQSQAAVEEETAARIAAMELLRHADRLKTVGRLASGMAHELGTPLNVVSGHAGLIASGKLPADRVAQSAEAIKTETDKMTTIIRQLLDFARRSAPRRAPVDLTRLVHETTELLSALAKKHRVTFSLSHDADSAMATVDADQVQQVLTNLIVNAGQAMPDGGRIEIAIYHAHATPPESCDAAEGDYFRIDVQDHGEGIAKEDLQHVFEPFFTTKQVGEGTGLGLSIAYGIVQEHGGWIDVATRPGSGTCFSVYLPQESS
ncbi:MAG: HAMP domain-containing protein [Planctomycetes bacterium]|nr:HAMP domain-containing protein [Planctomycetota bacterium]